MTIQIKLKNSVVQDSTPSTSDLPAVGEIALNANINSIGGFMRASDNSIVKIFGPGSLSTPTATTTVSGISELATNTETTTGSATNRVVTPAGLNAVTVAERTTSNNTYFAKAGGTLTGVMAATAGSNSAPAIHFGDSDSGIFGGTNTVSLAAGGTTRLTADTGVSVVGTLAVTGAITSTSDLTIAEKIIHSGDTDTFFSFPSANVAAVDTAGSERLRIDSVGRLLYGKTSNRQTRLGANSFSPNIQIEDQDIGSISLGRFNNNTSPFRLVLQKGRGTIASPAVVLNNDLVGQILFSGHDGTNFCNTARIDSEIDGTPGTDDMPGNLIFSTTADGANTVTERLRIASSGNVGIGTSTPGAKFTVEGTSGSTTAQFIQGANTVSDRTIIAQSTSGVNFGAFVDGSNIRHLVTGQNDILTTDGGNFLALHTSSGTERLRIISSGNVGIGTSTPSTRFEVRDTSATGISSRSTATQATDTNKGLRVRNNSDTDTFTVSYRGEVYSAGRIGIGETDPDATLHLKSTQPRIHLEDTNTNAVFRINADSSVGNAALDVDINSATSTPSFIVNIKGSEKMRLTSAGNLGIGTSSPETPLSVDGGIRSTGINPNISMLDTNASTNNKRWDFKLSSGDEFVIQCINDSGGGGGHLFKMTRSGNGLHTFQGQKSGVTWFTVHNNDRKVTTYDLDVDNDLVITNQVRLPNGSAGTPSLSFRNSSNMGFLRHSSNQIGVSIAGATLYRFTNDHYSPLVSGIDLGRNTSAHRFDNIYAANGTIQTSDKNEKNTIVTSDLGLDFINKLNPVSYKRNDGESGRTHYGLIAQEIETVISEIGKTTKDFAGFVKTTHTEDGEGNTVDPYDCYGLRYTQFISPIIKAIQELSTKVAALESA